MGGRVWSDREEKHFWRVAVAQSAKRAGADLARYEKSWDQLAKEMLVALGTDARREYSGTMLFEHYFQNIESQRRSPNAAIYVFEYLKKLGPNRQPATVSSRYSDSVSRRGRRRAVSTPIVRTLTSKAPPVNYEMSRQKLHPGPFVHGNSTMPAPSPTPVNPSMYYPPSGYVPMPLSDVRSEVREQVLAGPSSVPIPAQTPYPSPATRQDDADESLFVEDNDSDATYDAGGDMYGVEYMDGDNLVHKGKGKDVASQTQT
ncbi:hypothetical protein F5B20DRAFT_576380 [Whalleya microplaca]|nr:hypothetical protein F5B20DRAFT_576380 [Whalleya microplaca]